MSEASKTVDKLLLALFELADGGYIPPQQLAKRMGINRTVAQRLLTTLLARGYISREDGEYALSQHVGFLARAVQRPLRDVVDPTVDELSRQLQETVVFQIPDGADAVVLTEGFWRRSTSLQVRHEVGSRSPIGKSASGIAILAAASPDRLARLLPHVDDELRARIAAASEAGYALTTDELQEGVSGLAVGVEGRDGVVGSLAVLVPSPRVDELRAHRGPLERAARSIGAELRS